METQAIALRPLTIYVLHASDLLTDHMPHGDGLSAFGFLSELAKRGHVIHVAAEKWAIRDPLSSNITVHEVKLRWSSGSLSRIEYAIRARLLFERLRRTVAFDVVQQMVPVKTLLSLGMIGVKQPVILGTFTARWPQDASSYPIKSVSFKSRLFAIVGKLLLFVQISSARALLVTSPAAYDDLPFKRLFRRRTYEVHHGIAIEHFLPPTNIDSVRSKTVLFLGSLSVRKGIFTLLQAFDSVHREVPDARLVIIGIGERKNGIEADVKQFAFSLACFPAITFVGKLDRRSIPDMMRAAAIYCAPAYGEPYSTALLEAMACGCAVAITRGGGAPFMAPVSGGNCVPMRDSSSLAAAIISMLRAAELTERMGARNRAFVIEQNSWPQVIRRLEDVYYASMSPSSNVPNLTPTDSFGAFDKMRS